MFRSLNNLLPKMFRKKSKRKTRRHSGRYVPQVEMLEERVVYSVTAVPFTTTATRTASTSTPTTASVQPTMASVQLTEATFTFTVRPAMTVPTFRTNRAFTPSK